jgi:hypothetical protein
MQMCTKLCTKGKNTKCDSSGRVYHPYFRPAKKEAQVQTEKISAPLFFMPLAVSGESHRVIPIL